MNHSRGVLSIVMKKGIGACTPIPFMYFLFQDYPLQSELVYIHLWLLIEKGILSLITNLPVIDNLLRTANKQYPSLCKRLVKFAKDLFLRLLCKID